MQKILFCKCLVFILMMAISIGFVTLFERKILGFTQHRISPNKVVFLGLFQPLLDGIKLLMKNLLIPKKCFSLFFFVSSSMLFTIMLLCMMLTESEYKMMLEKMLFFILFSLFGMTVYSMMLLGWGSFSKYSMIGAIRASSQTISYELLLSTIIICFFVMFSSPNINNCNINTFFNFTLIIIMYISLISEMNRTPFDFSEGESELISGFNIELSSNLFVLMFLGEYGMILFSSYVMSWFFFFNSLLMMSLMVFSFMITRSTFPRFRYDMMMGFLWKFCLPLSCILLLLMMNLM